MSTLALELLLAACLGALAYHHFGYPMLVHRLANRHRAKGHDGSPPPTGDPTLPRVAVIVPAYNEETYIAEKMANLAAIDYPRERLHVVVALDGSTDATKSRAEAALQTAGSCGHIEIVSFERNRGKVAVLNDRIGATDADIVVLTDASAVMDPQTLRKAIGHFSDPNVGVVFPTYRLREAGSEGERAYTDYQTQLRADEGVLDSPMGGHGALYLFRRRLWQAMPADTINDDFILPMGIVARGARAVYDPSLAAYELERTQATQEFRRRVRIGAGNLQQAVRLYRLADPRRPWLAFTFLSGKGTRPFMPFIGMLAVAATAALAYRGSSVYGALLAVELLTLATAGIVILRRSPATPKILAWLGYLVEGHFASLVGALQVMLGRRLKHWQPKAAE